MDAITPPSIKERPVIMSGADVRAILDGRKTQMRRIVKTEKYRPDLLRTEPYYPTGSVLTNLVNQPGAFMEFRYTGQDPSHSPFLIPCPHGQPGDRLWVRETFGWLMDGSNADPQDGRYVYRASEPIGNWCLQKGWIPSIHMPRAAGRILLEVVSVRVERLQDISEEDAFAEGVETWSEPGVVHYNIADERSFKSPEHAFCKLWSNLYGPSEWDANPWVWVVEFKRVDA